MIETHQEVEALLMQTEDLLSDLLLSGFQGVHPVTLEQMQQLKKSYELFGMNQGSSLVEKLENELLRRRNSFDYELEDLMKAYSQLMFYIDTLME